jgi:regulator of sirC expression with transglutaminase-like and TPR domain
VSVTTRFVELVGRAEPDIPLGEAALWIAAHDHPVDVGAELRALDELAAGVPEDRAAPEAVARYLFGDLGFAGNSVDYGDPRNSFLDEVRRRRLGLPITLCVLMMEVARRRGIPLAGVGMPGHFLVRGGPDEFFDPFHGGARLDEAGCRARFAATRAGLPFLPEYLDPVGPRAILGRMLANLVHTYVSRSPKDAVWVLRLRLAVPGLSAPERREAAALLGSLGRFDEAAAALETIGRTLDDTEGAAMRNQARRLRSRGN